jgi:rRNA processing protein Gar1
MISFTYSHYDWLNSVLGTVKSKYIEVFNTKKDRIRKAQRLWIEEIERKHRENVKKKIPSESEV